MLVGTLKNKPQLSIILLVGISLALWILTFYFTNISAFNHDASKHLLYGFLYNYSYSFIIKQIITLFIVLIGAFLVNFLCVNEEITSKSNYLPALFYVLFCFSSSNKSTIDPLLVGNVFVLIALYFIFNSYRKDNMLNDSFKGGLFLGLASFFCTEYILVFIIGFIAFMILRAFNWREWLVFFIGLITPIYIFLGLSYLFNSNRLVEIITLSKLLMASTHLPIISEYYFLFLIVSIFLMVLAIFFNLSKGFGNKVKTQKIKFVLLWLLLIDVCMCFFDQTTDMVLLPCIIPLSIFIGDYLAEIKQLKIANTLLILIIGAFSIIYCHALGMI